MGNESLIDGLQKELAPYEAQLKQLESEAERIASERESLLKKVQPIRSTIAILQEKNGTKPHITGILVKKDQSKNLADTTIGEAAEIILASRPAGMTNREIVDEMAVRGRPIDSDNALTIISSTLKRLNKKFRRAGDKWMPIVE